MRSSPTTCAMCSAQLSQAYSGYSLPAVCIQLLDGGDSIDPSTIAGQISIDLCKSCTPLARDMIREYETSPLPECDADAATWHETELMNALARDDPELNTRDESDGVDQQIISTAAATVTAHQNGDAYRIRRAKIDEAYITLWSLQELGVISTDLL